MKEKIVVLVPAFSSSPRGLSQKGDKEMETFEEKLLKTKYPLVEFDILSLDDYSCEFTAQGISRASSTCLWESPYLVLTERLNPLMMVKKIEDHKDNLIFIAPYLYIIEVLKLLQYDKDDVYIGIAQGVIMTSANKFEKIEEILVFQKEVTSKNIKSQSVRFYWRFFI